MLWVVSTEKMYPQLLSLCCRASSHSMHCAGCALAVEHLNTIVWPLCGLKELASRAETLAEGACPLTCSHKLLLHPTHAPTLVLRIYRCAPAPAVFDLAQEAQDAGPVREAARQGGRSGVCCRGWRAQPQGGSPWRCRCRGEYLHAQAGLIEATHGCRQS